MTMIETEAICCPACDVEQEVTVYQAINAKEDPELAQKLMKVEINFFKCKECGHEAFIQLPLLFNDHRTDLKIQYYPGHWLADNLEGVCNDYLAMLKQLEKLRKDFSPFMPGLEKHNGLMVVSSMDEMVKQLRFRTKLFEVKLTANIDGTGNN
jgi:hypothetical protein